jgi:transposase InsO family protein
MPTSYPTDASGQKASGPASKQPRRSCAPALRPGTPCPTKSTPIGEAALSGHAGGTFFPTRFVLWLKGLCIDHRVIRSGRPTDNAEVERCHRTLAAYVIQGQEPLSAVRLEAALDQAVHDLAYDLPSQAEGCRGRPPVEAHPELLQPRRAYRPEHELALFDLSRVDAYLAIFTWKYTVTKTRNQFKGVQVPDEDGASAPGGRPTANIGPGDSGAVMV